MRRRAFLRSAAAASAGVLAGRGFAEAGTRSVLLETEMFEDLGGWSVDGQFMQQIGGAPLLAHGLGEPVRNASTRAALPTDGRYRLWVRTKDWCPGDWDSPGRFRVKIDGKPTSTTFGTEPGWGWQDGGEIDLAAGEVRVELEDLTGFDGRCDALYFAAPGDGRPPSGPEEVLAWKDRLAGRDGVVHETIDADLVIVGGGIAGCAAAMAAESQGLRVALVQDRPLFGGNASSEIRVHTEGIHGRAEKILKQLDTVHWQNGSADAAADDRKRQANLDKTGIRQFLNHRACSVSTDGQRIAGVDARELSTGLLRRFVAPLFVDCTGDGWLGYWAGADFRYGREHRGEFGEGWDKYGDLWSPGTPDNRVMGSSVMWNTGRTDRRVDFAPVPWAIPVAKDSNETRGDWDWEYSANHLHQVDDAETIRDHMLRAIFGTFANAKRNPKNAPLALTWVAHVVGKRESRRLIGDHVYTMGDAAESRLFDDTVVTEKRSIDVHYQKHLTGSPYDFRSKALFRKPKDGFYYLPFRTLYSRNIENLLMAGRCFSCSHIGLGGPRVQNTTGQMGVATGYGAAVALRHDTTPRGVYERYLPELRRLCGYDA